MAKNTYGMPPNRPTPGQIMRLLELSHSTLEEAAFCLYMSPQRLSGLLHFEATNFLPAGQWLLLNLNTMATKNVVYPPEIREYIREKYHGAFVDDFVASSYTKLGRGIGPSPKATNGLAGLIEQAQINVDECAELACENKRKIETWLNEPNRLPYGCYELVIIGLWATNRYRPLPDMEEYLMEKLHGKFIPHKQPL